MALLRSLGKGSGKKGSGEVQGQDFSGIVTMIRRVFVYANIGGPEPGENYLINVPATQMSLLFGSRGDKSFWAESNIAGVLFCRNLA